MLVQQAVVNFIKEKTAMASVPLNNHLLTQIKSFDFMLLILELEQAFSIELPFEQVVTDNVVTISQFINWVEQQRD